MSQLEKCDRRSLRSQRALRQALASELAESGDLSRINVASLTERAGLTRRTFYSHYRDIPDLSIKSRTACWPRSVSALSSSP